MWPRFSRMTAIGTCWTRSSSQSNDAQNLRVQEGLSPDAAIRKAASIRARPVLMTALAAFFALIPMALAFQRGSQANATSGRAVIGGILAGLFTTPFVVPSLYSLVVRDAPQAGDTHDETCHDGRNDPNAPASLGPLGIGT